jgi:hypothetical protein
VLCFRQNGDEPIFELQGCNGSAKSWGLGVHMFMNDEAGRMVRGLLVTAMAITLAKGLAFGASADARPPFFMFAGSRFAEASEREGLRPVLARYVSGSDYLSVGAANAFQEIGERVPSEHRFALPTSVRGVEREAVKACGGSSAGLIVYNGEHWAETPDDEKADVPGAIARAKAVAQTRCRAFGVAPDGQSIGVAPLKCSWNLEAGIVPRVAWNGIALFDIQAQILLSDRCAPKAGPAAYAAFVTKVAREVRATAYPPLIVAQISLRHTQPERARVAIEQLKGVVDGYYIAYPSSTDSRCAYCSPANLEIVLHAIRSH